MDHEESEQGFLRTLLANRRRSLKPTLTKVTLSEGTVQISDHGVVIAVSKNGYGFVVDTKPDLSTGQVTPWLFLSSQDVAADSNLLNQLTITHVLSLLPGFQLGNNSIQHLCLDLYDDESSVLDFQSLKPALDFISEGHLSGGRVLVHCNAGVSRAPSVVIFYLMMLEKMPFEIAWETVKTARPGAKPNIGFWNQLKNLKLTTS